MMPAETDPDVLFSTGFAQLAPGFAVRREVAADRAFLKALFCACSPLRMSFPEALLIQQAQLQIDSHRAAFPTAARWIVEQAGAPVGRIVLDWTEPGQSYGVDIALLPDARVKGPGRALLQAWLAAADLLGCTCHLDVLADNRARLLYLRLGFALVGDQQAPSLSLRRAPKS